MIHIPIVIFILLWLPIVIIFGGYENYKDLTIVIKTIFNIIIIKPITIMYNKIINIIQKLNNSFNNTKTNIIRKINTTVKNNEVSDKPNDIQGKLNDLFNKNSIIDNNNLIKNIVPYQVDNNVWFKIVEYRNGFKEIYRGNCIWGDLGDILDIDEWELNTDIKITEDEIIKKHDLFVNFPHTEHEKFIRFQNKCRIYPDLQHEIIECTANEWILYVKFKTGAIKFTTIIMDIEKELENIFKYDVLKDDYPHNIKELNVVNNTLQEIFNKYNIVDNIINKNIKSNIIYSVGCGKNYNIVHYNNNYTEIFYSFEYIDGYKWKLVTDITEEDIVLKHINYENMFKKDYNYNTHNNISSDIADDEYFNNNFYSYDKYFNKNFYSYDNFRQKYYPF